VQVRVGAEAWALTLATPSDINAANNTTDETRGIMACEMTVLRKKLH